MTVYYLSGPMRGHPELNFPAFEHAAKVLRDYDLEIISPHEMGDESDPRGILMGEDLLCILNDCDAVICLPGWEHSPGAAAEVAVAYSTEKPVFELRYTDEGFVLDAPKKVSVTVPREEQYRKRIPLIGLCGYAQSGKDTAAQYLVGLGWTRVAFADKLREMLYALNPLIDLQPHEVFQMGFEDAVDTVTEPIRLQAIVNNEGWDAAKVNHLEIRQLLQRLGTEAGRGCIDDNLWVTLGEEKIEAAGTPVVVTDCRFPNELHMIRRRRGLLVWIEREGVGAVNGHASEHSVSENDCDFTIYNNGSLHDLYAQIDGCLSVSVAA